LGKKIERPQYVDISEQIPARARGQGSFWIGFSLNLLNPALLPFWLGITSYLHANDWLINEGPQLAMYVLGAGIGTLLVMSTIAYFALRRKKAMRYRTRVYLTRIIGFAFLGFGVFQSYEISRQLLKGILQDLAETGWGQVLLQLLS
jgi:threonine/homoserine/homoserine lactone efflux protein